MRQKPKQIGNMKKVLSIILAVFCLGILSSNADNGSTVSNYQKPIKIISGTLAEGIDRSVHYVNAVLNLHTDTIEIDFYGLGEGEIYIVDQNNHVVESVPVWENQNSAILSAPQNSGTYVLVICCSHYYGEGLFSI